MRSRILLITALVLTSVLGSAVLAPAAATKPRQAAAGTTADAAAFVGTSVRFQTASNAIVNYTVDGDTLLRNVTVQSRSKARSQGGFGLDVDLEAVTDIAGAAITLQAKASTHATFTTDSGARIQANDNDRGTLVVRASGTSQYVSAELTGNASAEAVSDDRVVLTREDGTQGVFIVVGEGNVTVDANGNVITSLDRRSTLVYRQYDGNRSDSERTQEQLIANGTAVAEIYVQPAPDDGQQDDGDDQQDGGDGQRADRVIANVVNYSHDTTVRVTHTGRNRVEMTVERASEAGKVVITTLSKEAFESTEEISVTVDGEAAARAATYSDVVAATRSGTTSKFLVRSSTSTSASVDVVIGIHGFSARNVAITSAEDGTPTPTPTRGDATPTATPTTGDGAAGTAPGFGVATALGAVTALGTGIYLRRRR